MVGMNTMISDECENDKHTFCNNEYCECRCVHYKNKQLKIIKKIKNINKLLVLLKSIFVIGVTYLIIMVYIILVE